MGKAAGAADRPKVGQSGRCKMLPTLPALRLTHESIKVRDTDGTPSCIPDFNTFGVDSPGFSLTYIILHLPDCPTLGLSAALAAFPILRNFFSVYFWNIKKYRLCFWQWW